VGLELPERGRWVSYGVGRRAVGKVAPGAWL